MTLGVLRQNLNISELSLHISGVLPEDNHYIMFFSFNIGPL